MPNLACEDLLKGLKGAAPWLNGLSCVMFLVSPADLFVYHGPGGRRPKHDPSYLFPHFFENQTQVAQEMTDEWRSWLITCCEIKTHCLSLGVSFDLSLSGSFSGTLLGRYRTGPGFLMLVFCRCPKNRGFPQKWVEQKAAWRCLTPFFFCFGFCQRFEDPRTKPKNPKNKPKKDKNNKKPEGNPGYVGCSLIQG